MPDYMPINRFKGQLTRLVNGAESYKVSFYMIQQMELQCIRSCFTMVMKHFFMERKLLYTASQTFNARSCPASDLFVVIHDMNRFLVGCMNPDHECLSSKPSQLIDSASHKREHHF